MQITLALCANSTDSRVSEMCSAADLVSIIYPNTVYRRRLIGYVVFIM